ncbi:toxin-antitoxin system TumE family protein [Azospirillum sp. ST 5-10]|uniref:toxin-antitoxin system TumE family protein n=1 Tax=unclassified Azospirillum TaxID=2630922 RepID=UPI003F4A1B3F
MKATLLIRERFTYPDGDVADMVVWRVPTPVPPTTHGLKYRFAYVAGGRRVLGYDNERGKGDHRHVGDAEEPFRFVSVDDLLERFIADVEAYRRNR